jgi:hypothetical protein
MCTALESLRSRVHAVDAVQARVLEGVVTRVLETFIRKRLGDEAQVTSALFAVTSPSPAPYHRRGCDRQMIGSRGARQELLGDLLHAVADPRGL